VDEFIRDILGFYEMQLVNHASKTNELLQVFLVTNNFCDDSDPVFAALPPTTSLRNYISLRQTLQQMKLSLLSSSATDSEFLPSSDCDMQAIISLATTTRGHCWLWEDRNLKGDVAPNDVDDLAPNISSDEQWKLWFERAIPTIPGSDVVMVDMSTTVDETAVTTQTLTPIYNDTAAIDVISDYKSTVGDITAKGIDNLDIKPELHAAILLQRWWRRVTELMSDNEFKYDVYNDDEEEEEGYSDDNGNALLSCHNRDVTNYESDPSIAEPEIIVESQQHARTPALNVTYGTEADEIHMRQWLNDHSLPQGVADTFLSLGARSIDDICMLLAPGADSTDSEFVQEILSKFTPLDRFKLGNLVQSITATTAQPPTTDNATTDRNQQQQQEQQE
jgi:hypothetical protein